MGEGQGSRQNSESCSRSRRPPEAATWTCRPARAQLGPWRRRSPRLALCPARAPLTGRPWCTMPRCSAASCMFSKQMMPWKQSARPRISRQRSACLRTVRGGGGADCHAVYTFKTPTYTQSDTHPALRQAAQCTQRAAQLQPPGLPLRVAAHAAAAAAPTEPSAHYQLHCASEPPTCGPRW